MQSDQEVVYLYLDDIIPNRFQPREVFDERPLKELAVSIKEHGVIQPIIVRKVNDKYEIIAGERRYKASALAGLTKIPAIIRNLDDKESSKVALLENLQRKNLNPLEEARTYQKILEIDEMTQEELAKTMGKSQSAVANKLRLLSLPEEVQQALLKEQISERHARTLLNINDSSKQKDLLKEVIDTKMTVRQLETKIKDMKEPKMDIIADATDLQSKEIKLPENSQSISESQSFISDNPLIPNFDGKSENSNNVEPLITPGTISLPNDDENDEESPEEKQPKFINFGEIDNNDEDETNDISFGNVASESSPINIEELTQNTNDISLNKDTSTGADLDSLLRINSMNSKSSENEESTGNSFKFFSPAAEAIKDSEKEENNNSGDYFKAPDLINVDLPAEISTYNTNNVPLSDTLNVNINDQKIVTNSTDNLKQSIDIIRESLNKIESLGIKVEKDEMNLENSFQVVIKLQK